MSELIIGLSGHFAAGSVDQISQRFWDTVSVEAVADRIASSGFLCLVAEDATGLRGFVALREPCHLYHLFVAGEVQSQGLGKLLWERVLDHSACAEITVNASLPALPFYLRLGFERAGLDRSEDGITDSPMVFRRSQG